MPLTRAQSATVDASATPVEGPSNPPADAGVDAGQNGGQNASTEEESPLLIETGEADENLQDVEVVRPSDSISQRSNHSTAVERLIQFQLMQSEKMAAMQREQAALQREQSERMAETMAAMQRENTAAIEALLKRAPSRSRSTRRGRNSLPRPLDKGKGREEGNRNPNMPIASGSGMPPGGAQLSPLNPNRGQKPTNQQNVGPPRPERSIAPPPERTEERRVDPAEVQRWAQGVNPAPTARQEIQMDPPEQVRETLRRANAVVPDPRGPNMERAANDILAVIRPRVYSNVDVASTIYGTQQTLQQESEYWKNLGYKMFQRAKRAHEANVIQSQQLLQEILENGAGEEALVPAASAARRARAETDRFNREMGAGIIPLVEGGRVYPDNPLPLPEDENHPNDPPAPEDIVRGQMPPDRGPGPPRINERYNTPFRHETPGIPGGEVLQTSTAIYDGVINKVQNALRRNQFRIAEKSALAVAGVKIPAPEAYDGSPDLDKFEIFISKITDWLEMNNLLRPGCERDQLMLLASCLKGEAATWYYDAIRDAVEREPSKWDLPHVVRELQKRFIPSMSHHKAATQFHAIKQGTKTVQELMNVLLKYAGRMVEKPDAYTMRRTFIAALNPGLRTDVLKAGITVEFDDLEKIYKEAQKHDDAARYETGMARQIVDGSKPPVKKPEEPKKPFTSGSKPIGARPFYKPPNKGTGGGMGANATSSGAKAPFNKPFAASGRGNPPGPSGPKPPQGVSGATVANQASGAKPACWECGDTSHMRNYCPLLRNKIRTAAVMFDDMVQSLYPDVDMNQQQEETPDQENDPEAQDQEMELEDSEPNAIWQEEEEPPYEFDEANDGQEEEAQELGVRAILCPNYEDRRESLLELTAEAPAIKVAAATQEPTEPVYDHRTRHKERPRPPRGHPDTKVFTIYMNVGGALALCLIDSGSEGVMVSADYARALKMPMKKLLKPITLQLACQGSKSMINHGIATKVDIAGKMVDEYFDVANVDFYDVILGTPFLKRLGIKLDFSGDGEITVGGKSYKPGSSISLIGTRTTTVASSSARKD